MLRNVFLGYPEPFSLANDMRKDTETDVDGLHLSEPSSLLSP